MKEIYTLIIGAALSSFLIFLYLSYKIRKNSIAKKIVKGDKNIKRMYYILKKNKFYIIKIGKLYKFFIYFNGKRVTNELYIDAIVKKDKKYLCFITESEEVPEKMILYSLATGILSGILINIMDFSFKEYRIKK